MSFSSSLLERVVQELSRLPGIGKKTALRLALHLVNTPAGEVQQLSDALTALRNEMKFCKTCHNISDQELCNICNNPMRKKQVICVVESIRDVIAIENTQQYSGSYHVLGGLISPLDGIGPDQLKIDALVERIETEETEELIFALNPNIQGDTTLFYIHKKLGDKKITISTISRGISFGGELEYADEMTLARSIQNRQPVTQYVGMRG
ncbi:MAG: recombination mediator RecR [Bacteroidetes bacterium]|nr:recombination mediator RecR [Bacteroidota bacterium]